MTRVFLPVVRGFDSKPLTTGQLTVDNRATSCWLHFEIGDPEEEIFLLENLKDFQMLVLVDLP